MDIQFWGVRGYVPTPSPEYLRYGGNTCCTSVTGSRGELIVIDAGTGFCQFGDALLEGPFGRGEGEMIALISQTHWDHILGLPFPAVVHVPGNHLTIYGPDSTRGSLGIIYDGVLSPVYSPVYGLANIGATHDFRSITSEPFSVGGLTVQALPCSHQDDTSSIWSYRIDEGDSSIVYFADMRYANAQMFNDAADFARGADMLIHSAPYTRAESMRDSAHSRVEDAIEVALRAEVRQLFLFHHAPSRTDDQLDELLAHYRAELAAQQSPLILEAAQEGVKISF